MRVRLPRTTRYVELSTLTEIPLGSRIDARKGRVQVTAEVDATTHRTESSLFYDGIFDIRQTKGIQADPRGEDRRRHVRRLPAAPRRRPRAVRRAAGGPLAEPFLARAAAAKPKRSKRKVRRLWGKGKGSFRTTGRRSSATVRGTWWLVEDRCDGTLTRVREGRVDVRDFRLKKTIKLRAGKRSIYLAKAPVTARSASTADLIAPDARDSVRGKVALGRRGTMPRDGAARRTTRTGASHGADADRAMSRCCWSRRACSLAAAPAALADARAFRRRR